MTEDFLGSLRKTLKRTVDTVSEKTDGFVEIQKIRSRQHSLEDQLDKNLLDIGQIIYGRYQEGGEFDEQITDLCSEIRQLEQDIAACREEIAEHRGQSICPACGAGVPKDAAFCMRCGAPIPVKEKEAEEAAEEAMEEAAEEAVEEAMEEAEEAVEEAAEAVEEAAEEIAEAVEEAVEEAAEEEAEEEKPEEPQA